MPAWYQCQNIWSYRILDFSVVIFYGKVVIPCATYYDKAFASREFWCSTLLKNYLIWNPMYPLFITKSKTWGFRRIYREIYSYCYFNWGFDLTNQRAFQIWIYKNISTNTIPNELDFMKILHQGIAIFFWRWNSMEKILFANDCSQN